MASAVEKLNLLGASLSGAGSVSVLCRFGSDPASDLDAMTRNANADVIVIDAADRELGEMLRAAPVAIVDENAAAGAAPSRSVITCVVADSRSGRTAAVVGAGLALFGSRSLTIVSTGSRRRWLADLRPVIDRGVRVSLVEPKRHRGEDAAFTVAAADDPTHGRGPDTPVIVVDHTETSEEALGDRMTTLYAEATASTDPTPNAGTTHTTSSPERH
jgi:hypothetical protein